MDFADTKHDLAELVFQGADELDPEETCHSDMLKVVAAWQARPDPHASGAELFQLDGCTAFSISYDGKAGDYWPDEPTNDMAETLIREFLYRDGICALSSDRVRLFHVKYNMMAMSGDEFLLVCPYLTEADNISGITVVCVTKMVH